ncbi:MAG TPA: SusC/RagA family TonB-linked outer membrane protein [Gemmatimonadaceae bacterium]|nr:SusC/RagA family TonB-linked outer membrane protein [Gemmatimonadaceae bacterium]
MRKLRQRLLAMACAAALFPAAVLAQGQGSVQGTVVDSSSGQPIPSVQVTVAGTSLGSLTGSDGSFRINGVPAGQHTVRARRIGYGTQDLPVSVAAGEVANAQFRLGSSASELDAVVVTALGIEQQKRAVTNSVQELDGSEISKSGATNLVDALSGNASGVTITNSGTEGGSSRIVIRGASSLTGNNQPLFVVDGVPVNNSATGGDGYGAIDYGNAIQDINPSDIKSVSVLKGPNAAALYGSRAANGVILITTKDGRSGSGVGITASVSNTFETPLKLPEYQNLYGQGYSGNFEFVDGNGGGIQDDRDESWGPRLDAGNMIPQWFSNGQPAPWVSHPDNIRDFFETGRTTRTNVSFAKASEGGNIRLSVSNLNQKGMYPGFKIDRTTASVNGGLDLTDRLHATAYAQYIQGDGQGRPAQGYDGDNFMLQFVWFGRQVDMKQLRDYKNPDGTMRNWNYSYHNNPYWIALENGDADRTDRIIGNASVTFDFTDWLTGTLRSGTDWSKNGRKRMIAPNPLTSDYYENGGFSTVDLVRRETNTDFMLTANRSLPSDFSLEASVGGNRRETLGQTSSATVYDLVVPYVFDLDNAAVTPYLGDYTSRSRMNSLYGVARLGYRDWAFVQATGRNDWSSTLPADNRSYFYPSISGSLVFSDALGIGGSGKFLSYGKLRAGWTRVGNDADPYQLASVYASDLPFGGVPMFGAGNTIANTELKPELTNAWEAGTELRFLDNRVGLDFTYYNKATTNQILPVQVSATSGYTSQVVNAGKVVNKGVELMADVTPVRMANGFEWNIMANYGKNDNEVVALAGDADALVLRTYYGLRVEAHKGLPYGAFYGSTYVRDGQGNIVVGSNGVPLRSSDPSYLGTYAPDWTGGLRNTFRYKGASLSFLIDTKQGGKVYSLTNSYGRKAGTLVESLRGREDSWDQGFVVPGVKVVGTDTVPNDITVLAQIYHRQIQPLNEEYVYDASFVKLREVTVTYMLPQSVTSRLNISNATIALIGRNLWMHDNVPNIDPETAFDASNVQGLEYGQVPTAKSFGFSISVTP